MEALCFKCFKPYRLQSCFGGTGYANACSLVHRFPSGLNHFIRIPIASASDPLGAFQSCLPVRSIFKVQTFKLDQSLQEKVHHGVPSTLRLGKSWELPGHFLDCYVPIMRLISIHFSINIMLDLKPYIKNLKGKCRFPFAVTYCCKTHPNSKVDSQFH